MNDPAGSPKFISEPVAIPCGKCRLQLEPAQKRRSMVRIVGYSWVAVYADDFEAAIGFFTEKLGLPLEWRQEDTDFAGFRLPSGQLLEVFGPRWAQSHGPYDGAHPSTSPILGFEVEDGDCTPPRIGLWQILARHTVALPVKIVRVARILVENRLGLLARLKIGAVIVAVRRKRRYVADRVHEWRLLVWGGFRVFFRARSSSAADRRTPSDPVAPIRLPAQLLFGETPQAAPLFPRLSLRLLEQLDVLDVRGEGRHLRVTFSCEDLVEHPSVRQIHVG